MFLILNTKIVCSENFFLSSETECVLFRLVSDKSVDYERESIGADFLADQFSRMLFALTLCRMILFCTEIFFGFRKNSQILELNSSRK